MKNRRLYFQITFVFVLAFIVTSILIITIISSSLKKTYENIVFDQLERESKTILNIEEILSENQNKNFAFVKYSSEKRTYLKSDNLSDFIDDNSAKLLIYKASAQDKPIARYSNTVNNGKLYYIIINHKSASNIQRYDVSIILTDDKMLNSMLSQTLRTIILICLISFISGYLIVLLWAFKLVGETKNIASSLKNIGNNYYKKAITTKRKDEIGDLVQSIEIMRNKILQNEKHKQEIIQGVSHDLKTPIAIIKSYSEAIGDQVCDPYEASKIIDKQCVRLEKSVSSILDISRVNYIESNQGILEKVRIDTLIKKISKHYRHRTKANINIDISKISFDGTEKGWQTIIENILDNAVRYVDSRIDIIYESNKLVISNDGDKIPPDKLDKIFDLYEKDNPSGTGIGLYTVRKTLETFGYKIEAKNSSSGVEFIIYSTDMKN